MPDASDEALKKAWTKILVKLEDRVSEWRGKNEGDGAPRILFDSEVRDPYSTHQKKGQLNRIHVMEPDGNVTDIREYSPMIEALKTYRFVRAYTFAGDVEAASFVEKVVRDVIEEEKND